MKSGAVVQTIKTPVGDVCNIGTEHIVIALIVMVLLGYLGRQILNILSIKDKIDSYVDTRVEHKLEPMKEDICVMEEKQSKIINDITDIKVNVAKIATSLEYLTKEAKSFLLNK